MPGCGWSRPPVTRSAVAPGSASRAVDSLSYPRDVPAGTAVIALLVVVVVTLLLGAVLRSRTGRARTATGDAHDLAPAADYGDRATLVLFSTPTCARCPATARQLDRLAQAHPGVARLDVDLTRRPELASRFSVAQTPTVLVVDASRTVRTRFGGPPRPADVSASLIAVLEETARA